MAVQPIFSHLRIIELQTRLGEMSLPIGDLLRCSHDPGFVAELQGKLGGLDSAEHHVSILIENVSRQPDRMFEAWNLNNRARAATARHNACIHPGHAVRLKIAPCARVQHWLVFQPADSSFHRIERASSCLQYLPSDIRRAFTRCLTNRLFLRGHRGTPSVHHQNLFHQHLQQRRLPFRSNQMLSRNGVTKHSHTILPHVDPDLDLDLDVDLGRCVLSDENKNVQVHVEVHEQV